MNFKEKTLEDIIWDNSQTEGGRKLLKNRGLYISGEIFRQVDLGSYGRADLITIECFPSSKFVNITVYELKNGTITEKAFTQACRYVTGLRRHGFDEGSCDANFNYNICLIGDKFDCSNDFCYLYNTSDFVDAYVYDYDIDGISFNYVEHIWCKVDEKINQDSIKSLYDQVKSKMVKDKEDDTTKQEFSHELPF